MGPRMDERMTLKENGLLLGSVICILEQKRGEGMKERERQYERGSFS